MSFLRNLFEKKQEVGVIKKLYIFIASSSMIDTTNQAGKNMIQQISQYAGQQLNASDSIFKQLFSKVQKEGIPYILATGVGHSDKAYAAAFQAWLKSEGVNIVDMAPLLKKQIFLFGGDVTNPQKNESLEWYIFYYFDQGT